MDENALAKRINDRIKRKTSQNIEGICSWDTYANAFKNTLTDNIERITRLEQQPNREKLGARPKNSEAMTGQI